MTEDGAPSPHVIIGLDVQTGDIADRCSGTWLTLLLLFSGGRNWPWVGERFRLWMCGGSL